MDHERRPPAVAALGDEVRRVRDAGLKARIEHTGGLPSTNQHPAQKDDAMRRGYNAVINACEHPNKFRIGINTYNRIKQHESKRQEYGEARIR